MAQKVSIVLIDDLDESEAVETVSFGLDGTNYEIDLNEKHASDLRNALSLYVAEARKVAGARRAGRPKSSATGGPAAKDVREWAREAGHEVPERGRIPAEIREAYDAAH